MSPLEIFVIGATHHTAPLEVREKLVLSPDAESVLRSELAGRSDLRELAILNTCNRIEFYGVAEGPDAIADVQAAFCARQRFDASEFKKFRIWRSGRDVVQHLFEVAAGLDSQIVGETEILGQVKEAYSAAQARGATGPILNALFQKAFQAAKHVRTHTGIGSGQVSVANVAVDLALNIFGSVVNRRILLLGAGEIGEKTARAFRSRGAAEMTVVSRRVARAEELAAELGADALLFEERETRLNEFDVVVSTAAAPTAVWSAAATAAAMRRRPTRPLFFIDLALPRNVDSAVADIDNVFLYNLDDLAKLAEDNRLAREAEMAKCRMLLADRTEALWRRLRPRLAAFARPPESAPASAEEHKPVSRDSSPANPPLCHPPVG